MRRALILSLLLLAACEDRRSFDDRYTDTRKKLEDKARQLDAAAAAETDGNGADRAGKKQ